MKTYLRARSIRLAAAATVACGTMAIAGFVFSAPNVQADPPSTTAFVGIGADVTQDVYQGLAGEASPNTSTATFEPVVLHSSSSTGNVTIQSFDAYPAGGTTQNPGCITTKAGGPSFDRPNSSTAGLNALFDSVSGVDWENSSGSCTNTPVNIQGEIDFARSARGVKTAGSTLTFIPFARDAVSILYGGNSTPSDLSSLTTAEFQGIYTSTTGTATINGVTVKACLTIPGSAPRSNIETALGVSDTAATTAATAAGCNNITQNDGDSFQTFVNSLPSGTDAILPISTGSWIGQANGVGVDRSSTARTAGDDLASIDSLGKPYSGTAPDETANTSYYSSTSYGYNIYTVVPTSKITGFGANAALVSLFSGSSAVLCTTAEQNIVHTFGFDSLTSAEGTCGSTSVTGNG